MTSNDRGLVFPDVASPKVTVAMAVRDAPDWTRRTLEALLSHTQPCYELVVVDDASAEPDTLALLKALQGARVIRNRTNMGFVRSSNQAVKGAHGEYILFLNSDAVVQPGWLPPLLDRLQRPGVGAVAPMLLNDDGSVQQAGAILGLDGGTQLYGIGGDPRDGRFSFSRVVDYAAAACLLVRHELIVEFGAFDETFAPAYFEDADFCLRLAAAGWRTVYEPRSRVVHGLGASYGTDLPAFQRNHRVFVERWRRVLQARPASLAKANERPWLVLAARDAPATARILVLGTPPPSTGADITAAFVGTRVTVATGPAYVADEVEVLALEAAALPALVRDRRYHYEAVLVGLGPVDAELDAALTAWQPQALRFVIQDGSFVAQLRDAGF